MTFTFSQSSLILVQTGEDETSDNISRDSEPTPADGIRFADMTWHEHLWQISLATSLPSVMFALCVPVAFIATPRLRQHPAQLLANRAVMDVIIGLCTVISFSTGVSGMDASKAKSQCRWISFVNQFASFGSAGWVFILSFDLFLSIRYPFQSPKRYSRFYYLLYVISIGSSIGMIVTESYGLTVFNTCWIRVDHAKNHSLVDMSATKIWVWSIYYGPTALTSLLAIAIIVFAAVALRRGLPHSDRVRKRILKHGFIIAVILVLEWLVTSALWLTAEQVDRTRENKLAQRRNLWAIAFATVEGTRGLFDFLLWWMTQPISIQCRRSSLCLCRCEVDRVWDNTETFVYSVDASRDKETSPLLEYPKLKLRSWVSSALRHDIICCISWGIVDAVPVRQAVALPASLSSSHTHHQESTGDVDIQQTVMYWRQPVVKRRVNCPLVHASLPFDFYDYEPDAFHLLRSHHNVDQVEYMESFRIHGRGDSNTMSEQFTEGRSGSFFYFTRDRRYLVKTVSSQEIRMLLAILPDYLDHLRKYPGSMLTRFCGLHAIRLSPEQGLVSVIVMENVFSTDIDVQLNEVYDLKGSWVGRSSSKGPASKQSSHPMGVRTLKDCDLKGQFVIGASNKEQLLETLQNDTTFLANHGIMDYSLLVGVARLKAKFEEDVFNMATADSAKPANSEPESSSMSNTRPAAQQKGPVEPVGPPELVNWIAGHQRSHGEVYSKVWHQRHFRGLLCSGGFDDGNWTEEAAAAASQQQRGDRLYMFGVIDILQQYTLRKKAERFWKVQLACKDRHGVSVVNERDYASRFLKSVERNFV